MDSEAIYAFDGESYDDLKQKTFEDIDGDKLRQELTFFKSSIRNLSKGSQKDLLDKRGFVVAVNGAWGTGKSTAVWALINELDRESSGHFVVVDRSLLPFGSVNESISTFLNDFATVLKNENLVGISGEIDQFILESTPAVEKIGVTASLGPISLSRSFGRSGNAHNTHTLIDKFKRLRTKSRAVIVVLDDLDRLRPNEIVDVLRMIEKLRILPGVIVILPMYKRIINKAIENDLNLDSPSAATFMRKLTDAEINIENDIDDLKKLFDVILKESLGDKDQSRTWGVGNVTREIQLSDLVWAILLHVMIVTESIQSFTKDSNPNEVFADSNSEYLKKLLDALYHTKAYKAGADDPANQEKEKTQSIIGGMHKNPPWPFPVHTTRFGGNGGVLTSVGERYAYIVGNRKSGGEWYRELSALLRYDTSASVVTTDKGVIKDLTAQSTIPFDDKTKAKEEKSKIPIFIEIFYPLLQSSKNEPIVANNYKRRDMSILARKIASDITSMTIKPKDEAAMKQLFKFVKSKYDQFRG